ncbi:MAG: excalibur calcium-binding domain-containing protein [Thermomicrobiales bacterium]
MNVVKSSIIAVVMLVGASGIGHTALAGPSAGSSDVNITCGSFNNDQAAAQAYFDANGQPANLDQNGDGKACADPSDGDFTSTGPSGGSYDVNVTCATFSNDQAAAQAYFEGHDKPANLDQDGDGVACNDAATADKTPSQTSNVAVDSLPSTGSGPSAQHENDLALALAAGLALLTGAGAMSTYARRR